MHTSITRQVHVRVQDDEDKLRRELSFDLLKEADQVLCIEYDSGLFGSHIAVYQAILKIRRGGEGGREEGYSSSSPYLPCFLFAGQLAGVPLAELQQCTENALHSLHPAAHVWVRGILLAVPSVWTTPHTYTMATVLWRQLLLTLIRQVNKP